MDARTAESPVTSQQESWLQRERASGRFYDRLMVVLGLVLIGMLGLSFFLLKREAEPGTLLSPPLIALLLVAILLPAIAVMALYARKVAVQRAERGGLGSGRLHVRLVPLFTAIAAVPTVLVAIFASILFQSGLEFWFNNRARNMLENTVAVARTTYQYELDRVGNEATAMAGDLVSYLQQVPIDDPKFETGLFYQTYQRSMNEAAIVRISRSNEVQTLAVASGNYGVSLNEQRIKVAVAALQKLPQNASVDVKTPGRVTVLTRFGSIPATYLYSDGDGAHFLDQGTFETLTLRADLLGDDKPLLADNLPVQIQKFNGQPIGLQLPPHVELTVTSTEPAVRGDTASGGATKVAVLETGLEIRVPMFIKEGEKVKVSTENRSFGGRA